MKRIHFFTVIIALAFFFSACSHSETNKLIIGNWTGTEWLINGTPSNLKASGTHFSFDSTGKYTYDYAGTKEEGKYKIENDMLFTTATGQQEIMVKIKKLTTDSLVFDMSRGGQAETLTLVRK